MSTGSRLEAAQLARTERGTGEAPSSAEESTARAASLILSLILSPWLVLGAILALTFSLYAPVLDDWFQTDDFLLLRAANTVPFPTYVREAFDFRDFEPLRFFAYRPLFFVTNDLLYQAFGLNALPYHLLSVLLHVFNVALVWQIARRTTNSTPFAHVAAAVFGLHPVYATTVTWISTQNSVMATTGQLLAAVAFLEFMRGGSKRWLGLSLAAYGAAILYHQEVFLLPAALGVYYLLTRLDNPREALRSAVFVFAPFAAILGAFLAIQGWNSNESGFISNFTPGVHLARTYAGMLGMIVLPLFPLLPTEIAFNAPVPDGFGWVQALGTVLALGATVAIFWLRPERRTVIVFTVVWYHASLLLSGLFLGDADPVPVMARKIYPAGPAFALLAAIAIETVWLYARANLSPKVSSIGYGAAAIVAALTISVTFIHAADVRDETEPLASKSHDFVADLRAEHPTLPEDGTLYVAQAPLALVLFCTLEIDVCYLTDAVSLYYPSVQVETISMQQARDREFIDGLGPNDRLFCWRCGPAAPRPPVAPAQATSQPWTTTQRRCES